VFCFFICTNMFAPHAVDCGALMYAAFSSSDEVQDGLNGASFITVRAKFANDYSSPYSRASTERNVC
jgi:hypothetical protein